MKIKICKHFSRINKFHKKLAKALPNDNIEVKSCIKMCHACIRRPSAKVSGVKIKEKSINLLIAEIKKIK